MNYLIDFIKKNTLFLVIITGVTIRIIFALIFYGSYDTTYVKLYSILTECGYNIYSGTNFPHPPLWFYLIKIAYYAENLLKIPLYYLIKIYSILADTLIIYLLYRLSRSVNNRNVAIAYAFSSVAILITSFHAQQDPIILAFLLLSIIVLIGSGTKKYVISGFLYGFSMFFKLWPIFLIPVFLIYIPKIKNKIIFIVTTFGAILLLFLPYFLTVPESVYRNVIKYPSTGDFGLSIFIDILPNSNSIKALLYPYNTLFILLGSIILSIIAKRRNWNIFQTITTVFLMFYSFSLKIGAQYLVWVIPFGILTSNKFIKIYSIAATIALIANYYWNNSLAFTQMTGFGLITTGKFIIPWGISLSLWWLISLLWFLYNLLFLESRKLKVNSDSHEILIEYKKPFSLLIFALVFALLIGYIYLPFFKKNIIYTDRSLIKKCYNGNIVALLEANDKLIQNNSAIYSSLYKHFKIPVIPLIMVGSIF